MELTCENVRNIMMDCLFKEGESHDNAIVVDGITRRFGFHPDRLKDHESDIIEMLNQLDETFHVNHGGGWSFLQSCVTKGGTQWGEHRSAEELFALGIAIGKVDYLFERSIWPALPGGVPYFVIHD